MLSTANCITMQQRVIYSFCDTSRARTCACTPRDDGEVGCVFNKHNSATPPHRANCLSIDRLAHTSAKTGLKLTENLCTNNYFLIAGNVISCQRNIQMRLGQSSILSACSYRCDFWETAAERRIIVCVLIIILLLSFGRKSTANVFCLRFHVFLLQLLKSYSFVFSPHT